MKKLLLAAVLGAPLGSLATASPVAVGGVDPSMDPALAPESAAGPGGQTASLLAVAEGLPRQPASLPPLVVRDPQPAVIGWLRGVSGPEPGTVRVDDGCATQPSAGAGESAHGGPAVGTGNEVLGLLGVALLALGLLKIPHRK